MAETTTTTKVLTETGKATKAFVKAAADLNKAAEQAKEFAEILETLNEEIDEKQANLNNLEAELEVEVRKSIIDFNLKIKENEEEVLEKILKDKGLVSIKREELNALEISESEIESNLQEAVKKATDTVTASITNRFTMEIESLKSDYKVKTAETNAKVTTLQDKIKFLEDANKVAQDTITAERVARIEMASNTSQPVINIGQGK